MTERFGIKKSYYDLKSQKVKPLILYLLIFLPIFASE